MLIVANLRALLMQLYSLLTVAVRVAPSSLDLVDSGGPLRRLAGVTELPAPLTTRPDL